MTETEFMSIVVETAQTIGMWIVFVYLYISERKSHDDTRKMWNSDLREVAGMRARLDRVQQTVSMMKEEKI